MAKLKIKSKYGITPNKLLNTKGLTLKAKGLFGYLQSKPDDWDFSARGIAAENKEGIDAIQNGLRELEEFGYLDRKKFQNTKGFWDIQYTLYEQPITENPVLDNPVLDNPTLDNPPTIKTILNKTILNKEIIKPKKQVFQADSFEYITSKRFLQNQINNKNASTLYLYKTKGEQIIEKWCDVIRKLKELDKISEAMIEKVCDFATQDDFWKEQVGSMEKFRKKDKSGVPYFMVIANKAKIDIRKQEVNNYSIQEAF